MFVPVKSDTGALLPWEYLGAAAGTYKAGQLMSVNSSGQLAAISADTITTPPYLCMADVTAAAGQIIPVTRVEPGYIYETTLGAATATAKVGAKLQVKSGGLTASAPSSGSGTFELVHVEGTALGDKVQGRFL